MMHIICSGVFQNYVEEPMNVTSPLFATCCQMPSVTSRDLCHALPSVTSRDICHALPSVTSRDLRMVVFCENAAPNNDMFTVPYNIVCSVFSF